MSRDIYEQPIYEAHVIEAGEWYLRELSTSAVSVADHVARCLIQWPDLDAADLRDYLHALLIWSTADDDSWGPGGLPSPAEQAMIERVAARMRERVRRRMQWVA